MGNSLQDQLLKAGLANNKQASKARKASNNKRKKKAAGEQVVDEAEELAKKETEKKVERDRELNRIKQAAAEEKAIRAQIKQLIETSRVTQRGEIPFSFTHDTKVRTVQVEQAQQKALVSGKLAIVEYSDGIEIVPRAVASKIAERDDSLVILCNTASAESESESDTDDEYADYQVPDDLMW